MNRAQTCFAIAMVVCLQTQTAYAEEKLKLPTIAVMADAELREEVVTTIQPFQEDQKVRQALQHQVIKKEQNIQNAALEQSSPALNIQPKTPMPDMSNLSPLQREFVLAVASGLQSNDPSSGIFKMLEPLGIDRSKALDGVRNGTLQINFDEQRLNQLFGDQWRGVKGN